MIIRNEGPVARPLVLVTGATGRQGGSVARHLLRRGRFGVRALTRSPRSAEARALVDLGAEVVRGDLYDLDSVREAAAGCYGVFGVTNFWEHFEGEYRQGVNLVDAVADAGVGHFVFSTLPPIERLTNGSLKAPSFDLKARLEDYARDAAVPATFVHIAFYYENFLAFIPPLRQEDGTYRIGFPQGDTPLAGVAAEDVGGAVAAIFERRDELLGRTIDLVGEALPPGDYAEIMSRVSGRTIRYAHVPFEAFAAYRYPGAADVANMFEFYRSRAPGRRTEVDRTRGLYPGLQSFEAWMSAHREAFTAALEA